MIQLKKILIQLVILSITIVSTVDFVTAQEKISPKLRMSYVKHMGGSYEITGKAYVKKGKQIEPCAGAVIGFYHDAAYEKLYKKLEANEKGLSVLLLNEQAVRDFKDSSGHYKFYSRVEEDRKFDSQEAELSVMDAAIDVEFKSEGDTGKLLKAYILCYDEATSKMIPGVKIPLKCFVKRSLCLLPVGEELNYTGEDGKVEVIFPNDIPGDREGDITVIVKLDEDENYGTVQYEKVVKWGTPLLNAENPLADRSLIGSRNNAPWFMVIVINAILIGIWGYLFYIVYGLFKINKLGKPKT